MDRDSERDQQILRRLARIEHRVDSIDQTAAFALRAEAEKHWESVEAIFGNRRRRAQVYVAADGAMGVEEIAAHLGMKRQNVGRELKILGDEGLLELVDSRGGRDIWAKKALDRTLRVSAGLRKQFDLGEDGRPVEPSPKRRGQAKGSRP